MVTGVKRARARHRPFLFIIQTVKDSMTGRRMSDRLKICVVCLLRTAQPLAPVRIKQYFDAAVQGVVIETDIKFYIRTLHDFFVVSTRWEEELNHVFRLGTGMSFLDVGAHVGKYTLRAAAMVGDAGRVVAVEPNKENFEVLAGNIALNGLRNVVAMNVAAASADGEVLLFYGPSSAEHSIKEDFGEGSCRVKARALDNVLEEIGVNSLDLVKIDVEGAELEVLKGMEKTLKKQNPALIIEVLKRDENRVLEYLDHLEYKATPLRYDPGYREGLTHYCFKKRVS